MECKAVKTMGLYNLAAVLATVLQLVMLPVTANAAVYKVGDSAGWTTISNIDYKKWAATKEFHLSDVIVFQYNPQFHNVMQVSHAAYRACNASSPIATHTTGNDTITITKHGHYFFLCGVPGHCQSGQKVDIHVLRSTTTTSMAPSPAASVASSPASPVASAVSPGPSSAAAAVTSSGLLKGLVSITAAAMLAFLLGS
ncbi:mavicyanin-like [Chenopodium quinoa]|uniref:mavicyanin-like n=1 Tax=Chenopodium quinoa TaxID=63459 RepID=UPI000B77ADB1|nr:mavicyanin-like [Chenopodium quinoa]